MSRNLVAVLTALLFLAAAPAHSAPAPPAPAQEDDESEMTGPPEAPEPPEAPAPFTYFVSGGSWLGISIADIDAARAKELGLKEEMGAEIKSVAPASPAEESGLKTGDVIVSYQGERVEGAAQLTRLVRETPAGRKVSLQIFRGGTTRTITVKIGEGRGPLGDLRERRHHSIRIPPIEIPDIEIPDVPALGGIPSSVRLGAQVESLTQELGEYFGVKDGEGVLVRKVIKGGPGEAAGLRAGDVIVKVGDEKIADPSDLRSALRERHGKEVAVVVVRDRKERTLTVTLPKEDRSSKEAIIAPEVRESIRLAIRACKDQLKELGERMRLETERFRRAAELLREQKI